MTPDLAFNNAVSFMTNTNWQAYSPDTTVSYFTNMAAFAVQNFISAALGIAVAVAMVRGFARHTAKTIGNFWVDVTRCTSLRSASDLHRHDSSFCLAGVDPKFQAASNRPDSGRELLRRSSKAPWHRKSPSKCWEPMAADTSMRTRPTRTKIPRPYRTCCK